MDKETAYTALQGIVDTHCLTSESFVFMAFFTFFFFGNLAFFGRQGKLGFTAFGFLVSLWADIIFGYHDFLVLVLAALKKKSIGISSMYCIRLRKKKKKRRGGNECPSRFITS